MIRSILLILLNLISLSCFSGPIIEGYLKQEALTSNIQDENKKSTITKFGIEETRCNGTCPAYSVIFSANGDVEYDGYAFIEPLGKHKGKIKNQYDLDTIIKYLDSISYRGIKSKRGLTLDIPDAYTMIEDDGKTYYVFRSDRFFTSYPIELRVAETLMKNLLNEVEWDKK